MPKADKFLKQQQLHKKCKKKKRENTFLAIDRTIFRCLENVIELSQSDDDGTQSIPIFVYLFIFKNAMRGKKMSSMTKELNKDNRQSSRFVKLIDETPGG